jgi:hypothetical protein
VLFKILTKALVVKTNPVMHKLIDYCQNAFIKGIFIVVGVMLLHEILKKNKHKKQQGVVLKFDFRKAMKKLNGIFLFDCCRHKGFSDSWLAWIRNDIFDGALSVKINDGVGLHFGSFKRVMHSNPLPLPYSIWQLIVCLKWSRMHKTVA